MNNGGFDLWYQVRRMADLDPVQIDGWVFRLHYWVTSTAIFAASAVAFAKQYFGDPIECIFVSTVVCKIVHKISFLVHKWQLSGGPEEGGRGPLPLAFQYLIILV